MTGPDLAIGLMPHGCRAEPHGRGSRRSSDRDCLAVGHLPRCANTTFVVLSNWQLIGGNHGTVLREGQVPSVRARPFGPLPNHEREVGAVTETGGQRRFLRRHVFVAAVVSAVVTAAVTSGGFALASTPSTGNTYYACASGNMIIPGTMKVSSTPPVCASGTNLVSWNQTGPAGAQGPIGPAGTTGPQGPAGAMGAVGPAGPAGAPGAIGAQGVQGLTGNTGATGAPGAPGADGAPGATGAQGVQGLTGNTGATGPQGPPGPALACDVGPIPGTVQVNTDATGAITLTCVTPPVTVTSALPLDSIVMSDITNPTNSTTCSSAKFAPCKRPRVTPCLSACTIASPSPPHATWTVTRRWTWVLRENTPDHVAPRSWA